VVSVFVADLAGCRRCVWCVLAFLVYVCPVGCLFFQFIVVTLTFCGLRAVLSALPTV
jgi:hypothetical protein